MDASIELTVEGWQDRGTRAFHEGRGEKSHGLPMDSDARKHWQDGWHMARVLHEQASQQMEACPP